MCLFLPDGERGFYETVTVYWCFAFGSGGPEKLDFLRGGSDSCARCSDDLWNSNSSCLTSDSLWFHWSAHESALLLQLIETELFSSTLSEAGGWLRLLLLLLLQWFRSAGGSQLIQPLSSSLKSRHNTSVISWHLRQGECWVMYPNMFVVMKSWKQCGSALESSNQDRKIPAKPQEDHNESDMIVLALLNHNPVHPGPSRGPTSCPALDEITVLDTD